MTELYFQLRAYLSHGLHLLIPILYLTFGMAFGAVLGIGAAYCLTRPERDFHLYALLTTLPLFQTFAERFGLIKKPANRMGIPLPDLNTPFILSWLIAFIVLSVALHL